MLHFPLTRPGVEEGVRPRGVGALQRHRDRIEGEPDGEALVFTDRGQPWRRSRLARAGWAPLLKRAKLPAHGIHAVRHAHASALLQAGLPIPTVSARLGHSNASITLSVYSHVTELDGRVAAERVQALLGQRGSCRAANKRQPLLGGE